MIEVIQGIKAPIKIWATDLEETAKQQALNLSSLPFIYKHIAIMADAHAGYGSTVGSVIATQGAIIPSAIGVDIGCGMCAVKLPFKIDMLHDNAKELRSLIEVAIPVGFSSNKNIHERVADKFNDINAGRTWEDEKLLDKAMHQLGSLGGGNHFIEICYDENNDAWIMLHSGSRNIGKTLAEIHIDKAKGIMKQYFIELADPDLAFLVKDTPEFRSYINDLHFSQEYAKENRTEMMSRILNIINNYFNPEIKLMDLIILWIDCHHNYTKLENHFGKNVWITRKGAVSARDGEYGIIPGSMGTSSYIVKGKGNLDSFHSCSHGAGRKMSRTKARATFTQDDLALQTHGVDCRKDADIIDEIPGAYKDINEVMANQSDLVEIVHTLKQIICIKG